MKLLKIKNSKNHQCNSQILAKYRLTYDKTGDVGKEVRRHLGIKRVKTRKNVIHRISRDEEQKLINYVYL
jgi:hypothetical protein